MSEIFLSVVIPAYNEEENLKRGVLDEVYNFLSKQSYPWEVLVVDDGSTDLTIKLSESFAEKHSGFRVFAQPHRGKGGTVIAGMLKAKGDIVLFTDMDQATPIAQLAKLLPKFDQGYEVAIGTRTGRKGANPIRKLMAYGFVVLRTVILRLPYKDTQCGFKAFSRNVIKPIFERMRVFDENQLVVGSAVTAGFDLELLYIARKLRYKVAEVPVEWMEKGSRGDFGVNPIKDSWEGFRDLIKVRMNALMGKYKV
ncbi:MAG: glycosyltransferase [Patescibacteria group bacterium]